jgi:diguanylate cyclase (GGDEF)-like protein/PAS domain S-box-containing protein
VLVSSHYLYDDDGEVIGIEGTTRDITKLKEVEDLTGRLGRILDKSSNEIYIFDAETYLFTQVNQGALANLGYTEDEIRKMTAVDIKPEINQDQFKQLIAPLVSKDKDVLIFETVHKRKDSTLYPVEVHLQLFSHEDPPVFVAIIQDITERKRLEEQTRQLSSALEQTADSVMITDARGIVQYVNQSYEQMSGYSKEETIGGRPSIVKSGRQEKEFYKRMWETIASGKVFQDVLVNKRKDGSYYYEEKTITPLKDSRGDIVSYVSTGKDISERMQAQEHLQYLAHHDPLTELPNRAMLTERMRHAIQLSQRNNSRMAVLFLDVDRFKVINDSLGHEVGDKLLQNLAQRLCSSVREGDTVARLGGDEFIVLVEEIIDSSDVAHVARNIAEAFSRPVYLEDHELYVTTSIGISVYPEDGVETGILIKNADTAMYRAKDRGRNNYQFYSADMSSRAFERLTLESGLRRALEREEFTLHYQPQIDISTGRTIGVEALIRWQHPELGLVSPADFIPLLEETGMIVPVGEWILKTACQQNKYWQDQGIEGLTVSVNLSVRQFYEKDMVDMIGRTLEDTGLAPGLLDLEITESVIMKSADTTIETLKELNKLGVSLAIDDFGTGYSSLSYLKRFPIDRLKIDQAFVRDITTDPDDASIVSTIIAMAHNLKMGVVAEGVETVEQEQYLRDSNCEVMQGYLYSRPLTDSDATRYLLDEIAKYNEVSSINAG